MSRPNMITKHTCVDLHVRRVVVGTEHGNLIISEAKGRDYHQQYVQHFRLSESETGGCFIDMFFTQFVTFDTAAD